MRWTFLVVGKPALPWAREGVADYLGRLQRVTKAECIYLKPGLPAHLTKQMLEASAGTLRVLLDERGTQRRSFELARWIEAKELHSCKRVCLMIGGADGHAEELRQQANEMWSLSPMTLQHELALVVALEQVYRAYSIMRGEPYHRE